MAKILIVDDEESILDMLSKLLVRAGHEVLIAYDAEAALKLLASQRPDIAIVDLVMPGKGGLTLIMENLSSRPELAVIAMSGRIPVKTDAMAGLGSTFGIGCFLPKPFTPEELDSAIELALASRCA